MFLGNLYHEGRGTGKDPELEEADLPKAADCYRRAAELDDAEGQFRYAYALYQGEGVAQDFKAAYLWFEKAARQDHATACNNLGMMLRYGEGCEQNERQAADWFRRGADLGSASAAKHLSEMYEKGLGVAKDAQQAEEWARRAEELSGGRKSGDPIVETKKRKRSTYWLVRAGADFFALLCYFSGLIAFDGEVDTSMIVTMAIHAGFCAMFLVVLSKTERPFVEEKRRRLRRVLHFCAAGVLLTVAAAITSVLLDAGMMDLTDGWNVLWLVLLAVLALVRAHRNKVKT